MFEAGFFLLWAFAAEAIGIICFPVALFFVGNLADRGYSVSKALGIVLASFICYLLSIPLQFGFFLAFLSLAILAAVSLALAVPARSETRKVLKDRKFLRIALMMEMVFLISFSAFAVVRSYDPDISDGEKRMELAFLNAAARAEHQPPPYPWWSGESLGTYYYFGQYVSAFFSVLTGVPGAVSYNLALALFFGLSSLLAFAFGFNITRKASWGILFVFFMLFLANLLAFLQMIFFAFPGSFNLSIAGYEPALNGDFGDKMISGEVVWWSTRVIPWSVNEFPYFSFIWSDLHHTLMAIPFRIMFILICYSIFLSAGSWLSFSVNARDKAARMLLLAICLGFFLPLSTWDFPVLGLFLFVSLAAGSHAGRKRLAAAAKAFAVVAAVSLLAIALFFPLFQELMSGRGNKLAIEDQRTSLYHFSILFGLYLFVFLSYAFMRWRQHRAAARHYVHYRERLWSLCRLLLYISLIALACFGFHIAAAFFPIVFFILEPGLPRAGSNDAFVVAMIFMGIIIAMACEFVNMGGRYISLFKFYLQLWVFWALAAGYCVFALRDRFSAALRREKRDLIALAWVSAFIFLLCASSIYIFAAGWFEIVKVNQGKEYLPTLDGLAYLNSSYAPDVASAMWINANIHGTPVILEVPGRSYTYTSRISWMTGLPTLLGWEHHVEGHLSKPYEEIMSTRNADADEIYNTTDNQRALDLVHEYNISYIYVGQLEKDYKEIVVGVDYENKTYSREGLEKFRLHNDSYELVYDVSGVEIYRVR